MIIKNFVILKEKSCVKFPPDIFLFRRINSQFWIDIFIFKIWQIYYYFNEIVCTKFDHFKESTTWRTSTRDTLFNFCIFHTHIFTLNFWVRIQFNRLCIRQIDTSDYYNEASLHWPDELCALIRKYIIMIIVINFAHVFQ